MTMNPEIYAPVKWMFENPLPTLLVAILLSAAMQYYWEFMRIRAGKPKIRPMKQMRLKIWRVR
jgi:hypothetical protein